MKKKPYKKLVESYHRKKLLKNIVSPGSFPGHILDLQSWVITAHTSIDANMDHLMRVIMWYGLSTSLSKKDTEYFLSVIFLATAETSFLRRIAVLKKLDSKFPKTLANKLQGVNKIRNDFAHTESRRLSLRYPAKTNKDWEKVYRVYKKCEKAEGELIKYGLDHPAYKEFINSHTSKRSK